MPRRARTRRLRTRATCRRSKSLTSLATTKPGLEPISVETKRYRLVDARSQYRPYSDPCFDIGVAAIASPSGPRLAGRYGVGLLSVGATISESFDVLHLHWDVMEERAAQFGTIADRNKWRLVGPMHLAESKEQAIRDVR